MFAPASAQILARRMFNQGSHFFHLCTSVTSDFNLFFLFIQFESGILDASLKVLDMNPKYLRNPGKDSSGRRNPIYVSRVLSAMVGNISS